LMTAQRTTPKSAERWVVSMSKVAMVIIGRRGLPGFLYWG
jgi:hypothetical protein